MQINTSGVQMNTNNNTHTHTNSTNQAMPQNIVQTTLELAKLGWKPIEVERVINAAARLESGTPTSGRLE